MASLCGRSVGEDDAGLSPVTYRAIFETETETFVVMMFCLQFLPGQTKTITFHIITSNLFRFYYYKYIFT